jgi:archaellum component FlaF (FlaF/FlaG flagellin family)
MIFINKKNNEDMIMMKNLRELLVLGFAMIVIANGYIWTNMFRSYKEKIMSESLRKTKELTLRNEKLESLISEHKLEGMDVTVTMYHPVARQTDSTPDILADGTRIRVHKASEYRFIAVSRNLLKRWGGWLDYGDFILLRGTDGKDGMYQVRDSMNARFVNRIDILESPGTKPYKFTSAQIVKTTNFVAGEGSN